VLIKTSTGTTVQDDKFTYDLQNRRIGKNTLSGGQSWTGYDGVNAYADFNSGGSLTYRYLFGNAIDFLLARVDTAGNAMWYLTDKLGLVRENTDGNGNVLDSITYDTYGNILAETHPTSGDRFKYTSREWDSEIGQYYYRARYYGPTIGRFESEDPLGFAAGDSNLYRYVYNHTTAATDPTGLICLSLEGDKGGTGKTTDWINWDQSGRVTYTPHFPDIGFPQIYTYTVRIHYRCLNGHYIIDPLPPKIIKESLEGGLLPGLPIPDPGVGPFSAKNQLVVTVREESLKCPPGTSGDMVKLIVTVTWISTTSAGFSIPGGGFNTRWPKPITHTIGYDRFTYTISCCAKC
jgi:RHS repeat-associated protein